MGFFNVYVCDFISNTRSKKFEMFKNIIIKNSQQYENLLNGDFKKCKNDFFYNVAQEFYKLNRLNSIDNIIKYILKNLRTQNQNVT